MANDTIKELTEQSSRIAQELTNNDIFTTKNDNKMKKISMKPRNYSDLAREEKPEYRAYNKGFDTLTNVELISLIINRGTGTRQSIEQARKLVNIGNENLKTLSKKDAFEMQVVEGIGDNKAAALLAAFELCKRFAREKAEEQNDLGSATAIYNYMYPTIGTLEHEEAHLLLLNQNYKLLKSVKLSSGGITETAVDVRIIIKEAVNNNATIIALCHNHPSNNNQPSSDDDSLTKRVKKACEIMRIFFLDHVIITDGKYYSYREEGRI